MCLLRETPSEFTAPRRKNLLARKGHDAKGRDLQERSRDVDESNGPAPQNKRKRTINEARTNLPLGRTNTMTGI